MDAMRLLRAMLLDNAMAFERPPGPTMLAGTDPVGKFAAAGLLFGNGPGVACGSNGVCGDMGEAGTVAGGGRVAGGGVVAAGGV